MSSPITTHVLDMRLGQPARGVEITLSELLPDGVVQLMARRATNADGRVADLLSDGQLVAGRYRMTFLTGEYFGQQGVATFYPQVQVDFEIVDANQHYHVPLLLSPFGYSTYRGS